MTIHVCEMCNYSTKYKSDFSKHLKTKKHRNKIDEITRKKEENTSNIQKHPQNIQKHPQNIQKHPKTSTKHPKTSTKHPVKFNCNYCQETFTNFSNKRRHELHRCKDNPDLTIVLIKKQEFEMNKMKKEFKREKKELMKQIELLLDKVGNNYNTTINNNNIQINNYGSEDLSHITDDMKTRLLRYPFGAIQQLIEKIHFNRDKPENTNIMITNKRDNKISVFENGKWVYRNKKRIIQGLIDDKYYILDDHYNDTPHDKLSEFNHKNYKRFSSKYDNDNKELLNKIYEDTEIIILNKQD